MQQQQQQQQQSINSSSSSSSAQCKTCLANWLENQCSPADKCRECSGCTNTAKCLICNGVCGVEWYRDVTESNESGICIMNGKCALTEDQQQHYLTQQWEEMKDNLLCDQFNAQLNS